MERRVENQPSLLLNGDENNLVFNLLSKRCVTLATAVVQLLTTEPPIHSKWTKRATGVVCFVRDAAKRSYFIRVFDIDNKKQCVWQQEIYTTFEYKTPREYFHTFEADDCMAGLNFANEREADFFREAVEKKLREREQRRLEKRIRNQQNNNGVPLQPIHSSNILPNPTVSPLSQNSFASKRNYEKNKGKKDKKRKNKLRKEDISQPTDFKHITHIGWDPVTGFDKTISYGNLQEFFKLANVSDKELEDEETRTFIYDFIHQNGGIDRAIEEVQKSKKQNVSQPSMQPPHHPPPPLPPAPPSANAGFKSQMPLRTDGRSALLEQIRQGTKLNHVDPETDSIKSDGSSNGGGRDALMQEIRQGVQLKSVETNAHEKAPPPSPGGIAGALAKALEARSRAIQQTDESSSSSDSEIDDDEWDD
ncbi:neural Wiskott-Aldrich syndrome protein-like protein [Dinothrombium tinctorium]|uniref:Neural Wiskott-Aldrich syndrome protein-like protein n=1 Tax=Dinothrombium tinctorium TaxID=1965070 RepID=A0A3S3PC06_9ACAR|nr:neural Wiskott-Aldrich syndrome protein-like protein [Dinothrombium tinctorium]